MKITSTNLQEFLDNLPGYETLPVQARRVLAGLRPFQPNPAAGFHDSLPILLESGFVIPTSGKKDYLVPAGRRDFVQTLSLLRSQTILSKQTRDTFANYWETMFEPVEMQALLPRTTSWHQRAGMLYSQLTSPDWIEDFLAAKDQAWEKPLLYGKAKGHFWDKQTLQAAQKLVRFVIGRNGRVPIREALTLQPDRHFAGWAVWVSLRYGLLLAAVNPENMEPEVMVWPSIIQFAAKADVPEPKSVVPIETFEGAFLLTDMTTILIGCATEPLRLRATDGELFAKTVRDTAARLAPMLKWVESGFAYDAELRVQVSVTYLRSFSLVEYDGRNSTPVLKITERGKRWLALDAGRRLRVVVDGVINHNQTVAGFGDSKAVNIGPVALHIHMTTTAKSTADLQAAAFQPFQSLKEGFYPLAQILSHARVHNNPLLAIFRKDKFAFFRNEYGYMDQPDAESLEESWVEILMSFVQGRLLPLGGARLGKDKNGLSIAITPVGRYYLGQTEHWEWAQAIDAQVIVQPNFEVTFLGEAPVAEAEIGRFAERLGPRMGALFQITKKSIFAAAAGGMQASDVLGSLERLCTRDIPANVRREVQGWFAQCRKASFEPAMLIRCQDKETALRVIGLTKGDATLLNDTVLEYRDRSVKQRTALVKKLREMGVLVTVKEPAIESRPGYNPYRRW